MTGFQVFRYTLIVIGTIALVALFLATLNVWLVLWIAILIASALRPPIERMKRWGFSEGLSILVIYGFVAISSFVLLLLVMPPVINDFSMYLSNDNLLVSKIMDVQSWIEKSLTDITGSSVRLGFSRAEISDVVGDFINQIQVTAPTLIGDIGGFIGDLVLIIVMGIYWITSRRRAEEFLLNLLPVGRQAQARGILDEIEVGLGGYVRGIVLVSVIVGFLSFLCMVLADALIPFVDIPNAASLSFFYGLATAVPIIGGLIGVVAATGLALLDSPSAGMIVLLITFLLQQVENYYISPRIMSSSTSFDEILVIVFIAAGFTLNGLTGGLIAIPVAATAAILLNHLVIMPRKAKVVPTKVEGGIMLANGEPVTK